MYKQLINHIKKVSPNYPEDAFDMLVRHMEIENIQKNTMLLHEGSVCKFASFVTKGCFRYFTSNSEGTEFITQFAFEDWWVGDVQSVIHGTPSKISIEALEDCAVLNMSATDYRFLLDSSKPFATFTRNARARSYQAAVERSIEFTECAETRYLKLLTKHPDITHRIAQYHIASYLGITPESLSRLRKKKAY